MSSHGPCVVALNQASAQLWAITNCFLLLHVTRFPKIFAQYLIVGLLSSTTFAQFASEYLTTSLDLVFLENSPLLGLLFRYLKI